MWTTAAGAVAAPAVTASQLLAATSSKLDGCGHGQPQAVAGLAGALEQLAIEPQDVLGQRAGKTTLVHVGSEHLQLVSQGSARTLLKKRQKTCIKKFFLYYYVS